ncbi:MAG: hypothetical protein B7Z81_14875, partial [Acidocella sp. 20-61-6]
MNIRACCILPKNPYSIYTLPANGRSLFFLDNAEILSAPSIFRESLNKSRFFQAESMLLCQRLKHREDFKRILEDWEMAERRVRGEDAKPRGTLRVTAPVLFGRLHVLPIVNSLLHEYPALSIHLFEEGVDVAVRVGELADSSMIALRLGLATPVLVVSPGYLENRGAPASPAALSSHDIILFEGIGAINEWPFGKDKRTIRVAPRLVVNGADAAITAAEAGVGIARTLSYQVWDAVRAGRLNLVLQNFTPPPLPVSVAYQARRIASANVATFVKTLRGH